MSDAIDYFDEAVVKYSAGDVQELLNKKVACAGPLLNTVVNGIDLLGGMCSGFGAGSRKRSVDFMKNHMNIPEDLAGVLYSSVRCGCVHQGMPKIGQKFFVLYDRLQPGVFVYKDSDEYLWLNVVEFAFSYLDAVKAIETIKEKVISEYPPLKEADKTGFANAILCVKNDIQELADAVHNEDQAEEQAKLDRGEIESMSSLSAYTPDGMLNPAITIPPENV